MAKWVNKWLDSQIDQCVEVYAYSDEWSKR